MSVFTLAINAKPKCRIKNSNLLYEKSRDSVLLQGENLGTFIRFPQIATLSLF